MAYEEKGENNSLEKLMLSVWGGQGRPCLQAPGAAALEGGPAARRAGAGRLPPSCSLHSLCLQPKMLFSKTALKMQPKWKYCASSWQELRSKTDLMLLGSQHGFSK